MIRHSLSILRFHGSVYRLPKTTGFSITHKISIRSFSRTNTNFNDTNKQKLITVNSEGKGPSSNENSSSNESVVPSDPWVPTKDSENPEVNEDTEEQFMTTIFEENDPYMDTYEVFRQLTGAGFTPAQADLIINLLCAQLNSKLSKLLLKYSQAVELENEHYLFESARQEIRVDITRSREQHINELISLTNLLERDFKSINDELINDFIQMKNDNQVAISEQKSENTLSSKRIHLKIQETNHKITTELNSAMRSEIESLRWHLSRWGLITILVTVFSGCTAFYINKTRATREEKTLNEFVPLVIYEPSELELDEEEYYGE